MGESVAYLELKRVCHKLRRMGHIHIHMDHADAVAGQHEASCPSVGINADSYANTWPLTLCHLAMSFN